MFPLLNESLVTAADIDDESEAEKDAKREPQPEGDRDSTYISNTINNSSQRPFSPALTPSTQSLPEDENDNFFFGVDVIDERDEFEVK